MKKNTTNKFSWDLKKLYFIFVVFSIFIISFSNSFSSSLQMEWGNLTIAPETWTLVNLTNIYNEPIIVATPQYNYTTNDNGISLWLTNITTESFLVRASDENFNASDYIFIHYIVVEKGNWTIPNTTIKLEAGQVYTNKVGSRDNGWDCPDHGEIVNFTTSFSTIPVVLSVRASDNNPLSWAATFKHNISGIADTVGKTQMCIGLSQSKAINPGIISKNEILNWIAIDQGSGFFSGVEFESLWNLKDTGDSGGSWINGYKDGIPFYQSWAHSWTNSPKIILGSQTSVAGVDGSWPVIYDVGNKTHIRIFVDEANERSHGGSESGGGLAFSKEGFYGNFPPNNIFVNFTKNKIFMNQNNTIIANVTDINGNRTVRKVIATVISPNSTKYNISLIPKILNLNFLSNDNENETQNYTAITGGDIIGESGTIKLYNRTSKIIKLKQNYSQTPVVIAVPGTQNNDNSYPIPVIHSINRTHINISLCRDNGATTCDNNYLPETVFYAVFDVNKTKNLSWIDVGWVNATTDGSATGFSFSKTFVNTPYIWAQAQTYNINNVVQNGISATAWLSSPSTTGANLHACDHPGTANSCDGTATETFAYVAIDIDNNNLKDFTAGSKSISNSAWTTVAYGRDYKNPLVFVTVNSDNGGQDPKYPWAKDVQTSGGSIRYCEQDGPNDCDTHVGEDTVWFAIENGTIYTGNGGDDIEKNITIKEYNSLYSLQTFNITKLSFKFNITKYSNLGSVGRSNKNPDLEIYIKDKYGSWTNIGQLNITSSGIYEINVSDLDILKGWEQESKRDLYVRGINFDYYSSTQIDYIFWNVTKVEVFYKKYTSRWENNFSSTYICGVYNLTDLYSFDNVNINHTIYNGINFTIPCNPIVTLLTPINNSKLITNRIINFKWYIESGSSNLTCNFYINSVKNKSLNCSPFVNSTLNLTLPAGYYNWTVNVTDQNNLSTKPKEFYFYNILNYSVKIKKSIRFENNDIYRIILDTTNNLNFSYNLTLIDFVDSSFNSGSFTTNYNWTNSTSGILYNGNIFGWYLNLLSFENKNINYSITKNSNDYYLLNNYMFALE